MDEPIATAAQRVIGAIAALRSKAKKPRAGKGQARGRVRALGGWAHIGGYKHPQRNAVTALTGQTKGRPGSRPRRLRWSALSYVDEGR